MKIKQTSDGWRIAMVLLLVLFTQVVWSQSGVYLTSDQADYMAGTTVTLSGEGFLPGELVSVVVNHVGEGDDLTSAAHAPFTVWADNAGQITAQWLVPLDEDEQGASLVATATGMTSNRVAQAFFTDNVKVDFRQSANKDAGYPPGAIHWINSILQQSNSFYQEGMSSLQRIIIDDMAPTTGNIHTLKFSHQYTKNGHHAYDFITGNNQNAPVGWNVAIADYNPLLYADPVTIIETYQCEEDIEGGLSGTCADLHSPGAFYYDIELPDDPFIGVHGPVQSKIDAYELQSGNRFIRLYGDSAITNAYIACLTHSVPNYGDDGDSDISYVLVAHTTSTALSIEMGGHLAIGGLDNEGMHWGINLGAGSINGGPYHFRLDQLGGPYNASTCGMSEVVSLGAQDNQIKSGDIIPLTCECAITGEAGPVCPNSSNQYCAPEGTVTSVWSITGNGSISGAGNCIDVTAGSACGQSYTLTLDATNAEGCTTSCEIIVMVEDTVDPIITATGSVPTNSDLGCNPTADEINAALGTATVTDNCGSVSVDWIDSDVVSDGCTRTQTRTFTAVDGCNNTATETRSISWKVDLTAPVITATGSIENNGNIGCNPTYDEIDAALGFASSEDNCDGSLSISITDGYIVSDGCNYSQTRTFYSVDECGNSSSITRTISWKVDITPPAITATSTAENNSNIGCNPTANEINDALGYAVAQDNCDGTLDVVVTDSEVSTDVCMRTQTRTFYAEDECGNSSSFSLTMNWKVDLEAPFIAATGSSENNSNIGCNPTAEEINQALGFATADDTCDGSLPVTAEDSDVSSEGCTRSQTRTFNSEDECGNSSSITCTISWKVDTTPPTITATSTAENNSNIGCNPTVDEINDALGYAVAQDNCDGTLDVVVTDGEVSFDGCMRTQTRTFYAEDECGNSSSFSLTMNWKVDLEAPFIVATGSAENNSNIGCNPTAEEINQALGFATANDTCDGNLPVTAEDSDVSSDGCTRSQTRTFYSEDFCGNANTISRTISWKEDLVAPVIFASGATDNYSHLGCNPSEYLINDALGSATALDDCDGYTFVSATDSEVTFDGCTRSQTRTFYSEDNCGNSSIETRTISWKEDTTEPWVTDAPVDLIIECGENEPAYNPIWVDNCDEDLILTAISSISYDDCAEFIDQRWFAEDQCGNSASVARSISIIDTTPPSIYCPETVLVDCMQEVPAPNASLVTASDVCDPSVDVEWVEDVVSNQMCASRYTITRSYQAIDDCGNTSMCTQLILVNDQTAPAIVSCPNNVVVSCSADAPDPDLSLIVASDDCSGDAIISVDEDVITNQSCANRYTLVRTYRATDACGNYSTCNQTITVFDDMPPTIVCPSNITAGNCSSINFCQATASDGCTENPVDINYNYACNYDFPAGNTIVQASAVDACGNSASCNFTVTIEANPTCNLTIPAILPMAGSTGNPLCVVATDGYSYAWTVSGEGWAVTNGATSNCISYTAGAVGVPGTFCLTITNQHNCSSTCCVTFQSIGMQYCTYTQGFYGGPGKNCSGQKAFQVINQALANGGSLVIGTPANNRSITILPNEGSCLASKMPAGTSPAILPIGQVTCATATGSSYLFGNRFANVLVGQTIALGLNLRNSTNLSSLVLSGNQFTTAKASSCSNGSPIAGSEATFCVPFNVWNYLSAPKTVGKLYTLANQALGGNVPSGMTISQINAAIDAINRGFDQCRVLTAFGTCGTTRSAEDQAQQESAVVFPEFGNQLKLNSYPNPMSNEAIIEFTSEQDIQGALELYSSTGELVSTIFNGNLKGGETQVVRFNATELSSGIYICKLSAGDTVQYNRIIISK